MDDSELIVELRALGARWRKMAAELRSEVDRGVAVRQSPEDKLLRAEVLEGCAESLLDRLRT